LVAWGHLINGLEKGTLGACERERNFHELNAEARKQRLDFFLHFRVFWKDNFVQLSENSQDLAVIVGYFLDELAQTVPKISLDLQLHHLRQTDLCGMFLDKKPRYSTKTRSQSKFLKPDI